jgi:hypothetical protein
MGTLLWKVESQKLLLGRVIYNGGVFPELRRRFSVLGRMNLGGEAFRGLGSWSAVLGKSSGV